jgi:hypothetical protein
MRRFVSAPLKLPPQGRSDVSRADLVFYGVDHAGPSYEALIFLDNPGATERTGRTGAQGFAGSFTVFGHGGCYGDEGHCHPDQGTRDEFDRRPPHPLTPQTKTVVCTDALKRIRANSVTVTVVAVEPGKGRAAGDEGPLEFELLRLLLYED